MIIVVNDIDISSHLLELKLYNEMNSDSLILGNAVCKKIEIKLDNQKNELNDLFDYPFHIYYKDNKLLGIFKVYNKPEKYTGELSVTLYDNMYLFSDTYNSQFNYDNEITIADQLEEMSNMTGISIDVSNIHEEILLKCINWYDNTISMRNYIGWIAELNGSNAFVNENGTVVFRDLATVSYDTVDIESYEKGEKVYFSRICFDDGILKLEKGDKSGNTLYISSNNAYVDSQTSLDIIYNKYQGLSFYSVKAVKMANIENMYLTDLINYNDEFVFMPLSLQEVYGGGTYSIDTISGEINAINAEITINKIDTSTKIRRIQTIVDKNDASLKIISENINDHDEAITKLEITTEGFKQTAEKVEELETKVAVTYYIESSLGYNFADELEEETTLVAHIYLGDKEFDESAKLQYSWFLVNDDKNETYLGEGKSINVNVQTLGGNSVYFIANDFNDIKTTSILGQSLLGQMILGQNNDINRDVLGKAILGYMILGQ